MVHLNSSEQKLCFEVAIVSAILFVVWSLLSLPIIFYFLPDESMKKMMNESQIVSSVNSSLCSNAIQYSAASDICFEELYNILLASNCSQISQQVLVLNCEQSMAEEIINGLDAINAGEECKDKIIPFVCLDSFGLCSESAMFLHPTSTQCESIKDFECQTEWKELLQLGIDLPMCMKFPHEKTLCKKQSFKNKVNTTENCQGRESSKPNEGRKICSDGYYFENSSSRCIPNCQSFVQFSLTLHTDSVDLCLSAFIIGFGASTLAVILSCVRYKYMLKFPSVFIFYIAIDSTINEFIGMVRYFNTAPLACSSKSLIESLQIATPYCVLLGFMFIYILLQEAMWWLFHITAFFWKVYFPFHARSYQLSKKIKYIHIVCVVVGLILPLVPVVTLMGTFAKKNKASQTNVTFLSGGAGIRPFICSAIDADAIFYSLTLLLYLIMILGCSLLILIMWYMIRQRKKFGDQKKAQFGSVEKKLLIVLFYYVILVMGALTGYTLSPKSQPRLFEDLRKDFVCEQDGHNQDNPCSNFESGVEGAILTSLSCILISLLPVINMIFIVDIKATKTAVCKLWSKKKLNGTKLMTAVTPKVQKK